MAQEIDQSIVDQINSLSHYEMCSIWRFGLPKASPSEPHIYFDNTKPYSKIFQKRLFEHFGGFTREISKDLGW